MIPAQRFNYALNNETSAITVQGMYKQENGADTDRASLDVQVKSSKLEELAEKTLIPTSICNMKLEKQTARDSTQKSRAVIYIASITERYDDSFLLNPAYASQILEGLSPMQGTGTQFTFSDGRLISVKQINEKTQDYKSFSPEHPEALTLSQQFFGKDIREYHLDTSKLLSKTYEEMILHKEVELISSIDACLKEDKVHLVQDVPELAALIKEHQAEDVSLPSVLGQIDIASMFPEEAPLLLTDIVEEELPCVRGDLLQEDLPVILGKPYVFGESTDEFLQKGVSISDADGIIYLNPDQTKDLFGKSGI